MIVSEYRIIPMDKASKKFGVEITMKFVKRVTHNSRIMGMWCFHVDDCDIEMILPIYASEWDKEDAIIGYLERIGYRC